MSTTRSRPRRTKVVKGRKAPAASHRPYFWMLCGCVAFTLMGAFAHSLRDRCDWQVIALARSSVALVLAAALVVIHRKRFVVFKPRILWMRSLAGSVSLVCTFYAFTRLPTADVFTLTNMVPLWVALFSWPLLGRPPSAAVWACIVLGIAGVALIQQPEHLTEGNFAVLLAVFSSLTSAVAMLGLNRLRYLDYRAIVVHFSAVAAAVCAAALFVCERRHPYTEILSGGTLFALLATGFCATVGQLFLTRAYADGTPAKVAVIGLSQVVLSLGLDVLLFDHGVSALTLLGMGLVVGPTAWVLVRQAVPVEAA
jgi:drug/metabolite transporter (DMT)-like permease